MPLGISKYFISNIIINNNDVLWSSYKLKTNYLLPKYFMYVLCVESKGSSIYLVINWSTAHATQNSTQTNVHLFKFSEY